MLCFIGIIRRIKGIIVINILVTVANHHTVIGIFTGGTAVVPRLNSR